MLRIPDVSEEKKMPAGEYVCRIVKAEAGTNRYEEPCLLLYLDVAEGDFENYFGRIYKRRLQRGEDKYPCVHNQSVGRYGKKYFERLITAIEASNVGYFCSCKEGADWDERELEKLLVGVVFREKEFINARGKKRIHLVPSEFKSVNAIRRGHENGK